jgi:hypothetical protein
MLATFVFEVAQHLHNSKINCHAFFKNA